MRERNIQTERESQLKQHFLPETRDVFAFIKRFRNEILKVAKTFEILLSLLLFFQRVWMIVHVRTECMIAGDGHGDEFKVLVHLLNFYCILL